MRTKLNDVLEVIFKSRALGNTTTLINHAVGFDAILVVVNQQHQDYIQKTLSPGARIQFLKLNELPNGYYGKRHPVVFDNYAIATAMDEAVNAYQSEIRKLESQLEVARQEKFEVMDDRERRVKELSAKLERLKKRFKKSKPKRRKK